LATSCLSWPTPPAKQALHRHAPARWVAAQRALAIDPMVLLREE